MVYLERRGAHGGSMPASSTAQPPPAPPKLGYLNLIGYSKNPLINVIAFLKHRQFQNWIIIKSIPYNYLKYNVYLQILVFDVSRLYKKWKKTERKYL